MTPQQREAALRLVDIALKHSADSDSDISEETALLRELASEPVQEPVAWRSKERINGEFDSGWKLTSNEPPQTPRTIAIEPLYTHPPQQRQPLTKFDVMSALALVPSQLSNLERCIWIAEALNKRAHGIGD